MKVMKLKSKTGLPQKLAVLAALIVLLAFALVFSGCDIRPGIGGPSAPQSVQVSGETTANSIHITWSASPYGPAEYRVERANSSAGPWTTITRTSANQFTDTGLPPNTTMFYRITRIVNGVEGSPSQVVSGTTRANGTGGGGGDQGGQGGQPGTGNQQPPDTPTIWFWYARSNRIVFQIRGWEHSTEYRIERANSPTGPWGTILRTRDNTITDPGLSPNTTMYYRAFAIRDGVESAPSPTVSMTTGPLAPTGVRVIPLEQRYRIQITWNAVPGATHYEIRTSFREYPDGYNVIIGRGVTETSFETGYNMVTNNSFRVIAYNSAGSPSDSSSSAGISSPW